MSRSRIVAMSGTVHGALLWSRAGLVALVDHVVVRRVPALAGWFDSTG